MHGAASRWCWVVTIAGTTACVEGGATKGGRSAGTEGGVCYENGSCDSGLVCSSASVCVRDDSGTVDPCSGITCTGHGLCSTTDGTARCSCEPGYHAQGHDCLADADPCDGISCSGHGACVVAAGEATCDCDASYHADGLTCVADTTAPSPTVALWAEPAVVGTGETTTLSWSSADATSCTASGAWSGAKALSGSASSGPISANAVFTLSCSGNGGTASDSATVFLAGTSLTVGYDHTTRSVTAAAVVLDLAQPSEGNYPAWVSGAGYPNLLRAATHEVIPTGGYFGRGFSRFSPGDADDGHRGEHYCGIGQIHGFDDVGDSSRMVVGQLLRFGTTFFTDQATRSPPNGDIKLLILINDSGERPMVISKGGATRVLGACHGTVCNTTNSTSNIDYFNDGGHSPDINAYLGQWLWVELALDSSVPYTRVRTWSADGTLQGAETIAPWASAGSATTLDVIGFVNGIPNPGAQPYYDVERIEFQIGSDRDITPPAGFPGSAR